MTERGWLDTLRCLKTHERSAFTLGVLLTKEKDDPYVSSTCLKESLNSG